MLSSQGLSRAKSDPDDYLNDFSHRSQGREFISIKNSDAYFQDLYLYHKNGGYWNIIYSKISNLVIIAFTITFSVFLIGFVSWSNVLKCGNAEQCQNITIIENNLMKNKIFGAIVIIYTAVFVLYFIWHFAAFIVSLSSLKPVKRSESVAKHMNFAT